MKKQCTRRDRDMVVGVQLIKAALRAAGLRAKVRPSDATGRRHIDVVVILIDA